MITNSAGKQHERIEYAPYGETWIEHRYDEDTLSLPYRFTGKEMDEETGFYYYGARYLDPKTSRWLSADPALGEYIPAAPVNDETRRRNGNLPGMGGIFNMVNLHVYHYAGNNPVKYVDPDGRELDYLFSYSKMNDPLWKEEKLNNINGSLIGKLGCALTGMANIFTNAWVRKNPRRAYWGLYKAITPRDINRSGNFHKGTDNLNWDAAASTVGMTASRSEIGNADAAQAQLINASHSAEKVFALAQVPITTSSGDSGHWIGVDGPLVDLKNDAELWIKVSPTSLYDSAARLNNPNWAQGNDGKMYVKFSSVTGSVIVK